jgi:hypothetical protein
MDVETDGQTYQRIIGAVAANNNSHINLPLFASAIVRIPRRREPVHETDTDRWWVTWRI